MSKSNTHHPKWARIRNPEELKRAHDPTVYALSKSEIWWRDHTGMLKSHGYVLRARYQPGWSPSWLNTDLNPEFCEDSVKNDHSETIDAIRESDGVAVAIKRLPTEDGGREGDIAQYLTTAERMTDPANHSVPILDRFRDQSEPFYEFLVMPQLRHFFDPPFHTTDEVLDFIKQTLEGILFIHNQGVAHRDCSHLNIMFDGTALYPGGYHPQRAIFAPNLLKIAEARSRRDVPSVKYYFTDYGISTRFEDPNEPRRVTGDSCQDHSAPELSLENPYDPFPLDIYLLGNVYKRRLVKVYSNLEFLDPLTTAMTQRDPNARPTAGGTLALLREIIDKQPAYRLRWRLHHVREGRMTRISQDFQFISSEGFRFIKRLIKTY